MPSINSQYNPWGSSDETPITPYMCTEAAPKQSSATQEIQEQLIDADSYAILEAEENENHISFSFLIDGKFTKAVALITKPKQLQTININNFVSVYLFTRNINDINTINRLDLKADHMDIFKQRIIDKLFDGISNKSLYISPNPSNGDYRSRRNKSLHQKVPSSLAA